MDWTLTFIVLGAAIALLALSFWQTSRPPKDTPRARWISWRFMILVAGALILLTIVHMVNLMGYTTGSDQPPGRHPRAIGNGLP
jgi:drug/metabolite transporter (DMT)-like permease